jgi:AcrR family transcriptional regulator
LTIIKDHNKLNTVNKMRKKSIEKPISSKSSLRRERERRELRQKILTSARNLFLEKGYEGFSLRQVAEEIGYSATTIYMHFDDKDDLLVNIIDQAYEKFTERMQHVFEQTQDPLERIYNLGKSYIDFGINNPEAYQLIFMQRPDLLLKWMVSGGKQRKNSLLILRESVKEAVEAGVIRYENSEEISDALWAAVHGAVSLNITMPAMFGASNLEKSLSTTLEIIREGLVKR